VISYMLEENARYQELGWSCIQKYATIYDKTEGRARSKDNTTPECAPGVRKATMKSGIYRQVYKSLRNLRTYSVFQTICKALK